MQGGTPLIEDQLSHFRNVIFLCPTYQVIECIWPKAMERYTNHCVKVERSKYLFDFGSAYLKFVPLTDRTYEMLQGHRGVIIRHPELLFEHGRDEKVASLIKHRNQQYGDSKPRTT